MDKMIDLRSDTVTMPTEEMYDAMVKAELGDDVFQEDPTVNELENKAAGIMGKSAGLLVPSGTMGNLVSILVHCKRGTEILLGDKSHTFYYEAGGISSFGGIHSHQLHNEEDGTIEIQSIKNAIRHDNIHFPKTALISLENTHNKCFGYPLSKDYLDSVADIAQENNLKLHIDGARIFNATVALDMSLSALVENVDSVTFCLSKGLACPVGSLICGSTEFIQEARRIRKALGGGMRQAGIIAAAGLAVLDNINNQNVVSYLPSDNDDSYMHSDPKYFLKWIDRVKQFNSKSEINLNFQMLDFNDKPSALEPYIQMGGHGAVLSNDASTFIHIHPIGTISMASQELFNKQFDIAQSGLCYYGLQDSTLKKYYDS